MSAFEIAKGAVLTECGLHRLALLRAWSTEKPILPVVMVNPSTADHEVDDPTILRLIAFARLWGFGGIEVVNLFSLRSSSPAVLVGNADAFHPDNGVTLSELVERAQAQRLWVLAAWGNNGVIDGGEIRDVFMADCREHGVELRCLGTTQGGHPKHPLARGKHRVPDDFRPIPYGAAEQSKAA